MSISDKGENQIYNVFSDSNLPKNTAFAYREFEFENTKYYVSASLYSAQVKDLYDHLNAGLDYFVTDFKNNTGDLLADMKSALFNSGDSLADHLLSLKLPVEDVDYSVCFLAFRDGVVYVWIDGDLNVRMYRGAQSMLINSQSQPQYYGSATVELGDILSISNFKNLSEEDPYTEKYVLNEAEPKYHGIFIDYQIDYASEELFSVISDETREDIPEIQEQGLVDQNPVDKKNEVNTVLAETKISHKDIEPDQNFKFNAAKTKILQSATRLRDSASLERIQSGLKGLGSRIWKFFMSITSAGLDLIFGLIYRNNPHKLKRFHGSTRKTNLQYLTIVLVLLFSGYLILSRAPSTDSPSSIPGATINQSGNNQSNIQASLQKKFDDLKLYATAKNIEQFNATYTSLNGEITMAKKNNFPNQAFLTTIETESRDLEFNLYNITKIEKADEIFVATNIPNAKIVDFSIVSNTVYAVDRANAQILISNGGLMQFDVFASDTQLTSMNNISCLQTSCYITDDNIGLVILNLQTKTFSKFTASETLKKAGMGVQELEVFLVSSTPYVYTFIPSENKILRYIRNGDGFKNPEVWNKAAGFGGTITDFTIDGGIFEISNSGSVRRFFGGNIDANFTGISPALLPLGTSLQIATTPARATSPNNINRFYIADSDNQRIVVYEKDLNPDKKYTFKGSYKYTGNENLTFVNIKQLIMGSDEKTLYGLSDNKVFRVSVSAL